MFIFIYRLDKIRSRFFEKNAKTNMVGLYRVDFFRTAAADNDVQLHLQTFNRCVGYFVR